jgi:hypothetical protein
MDGSSRRRRPRAPASNVRAVPILVRDRPDDERDKPRPAHASRSAACGVPHHAWHGRVVRRAGPPSSQPPVARVRTLVPLALARPCQCHTVSAAGRYGGGVRAPCTGRFGARTQLFFVLDSPMAPGRSCSAGRWLLHIALLRQFARFATVWPAGRLPSSRSLSSPVSTWRKRFGNGKRERSLHVCMHPARVTGGMGSLLQLATDTRGWSLAPDGMTTDHLAVALPSNRRASHAGLVAGRHSAPSHGFQERGYVSMRAPHPTPS